MFHPDWCVETWLHTFLAPTSDGAEWSVLLSGGFYPDVNRPPYPLIRSPQSVQALQITELSCPHRECNHQFSAVLNAV
jgi:hypothetical protein